MYSYSLSDNEGEDDYDDVGFVCFLSNRRLSMKVMHGTSM